MLFVYCVILLDDHAQYCALHPGLCWLAAVKMAASGRSTLLSSNNSGLNSTAEQPNTEDEDGQDLWWEQLTPACLDPGGAFRWRATVIVQTPSDSPSNTAS